MSANDWRSTKPKLPLDVFREDKLHILRNWLTQAADDRQRNLFESLFDGVGRLHVSAVGQTKEPQTEREGSKTARNKRVEEQLERMRHMQGKWMRESTYRVEHCAAHKDNASLPHHENFCNMVEPYLKALIKAEKMDDVRGWLSAKDVNHADTERKNEFFATLCSLACQEVMLSTEYRLQYIKKEIMRPNTVPTRVLPVKLQLKAQGIAQSLDLGKMAGEESLASPRRGSLTERVRDESRTAALRSGSMTDRQAPTVLPSISGKRSTQSSGEKLTAPVENKLANRNTKKAETLMEAITGKSTRNSIFATMPPHTWESTYKATLGAISAADAQRLTSQVVKSLDWHHMPTASDGHIVLQMAPGGGVAHPSYSHDKFDPVMSVDLRRHPGEAGREKYPWPETATQFFFKGTSSGRQELIPPKESEIPIKMGSFPPKESTYRSSYRGAILH